MITYATIRGDYAHLAAACTDVDGAAVDPTSAEAVVYEVSELTGALSRCSSVGTNGVLTLTKQDNQTGFYGAALDIGLLQVRQYLVLFKATIDGIDSIGVDYLPVDEDPHLREVVANAVYANSSDTMTVNAWLLEQGEAVTDPVDCTFELYDDSGALVFTALESSQCDSNGVFRLTKAQPGLGYDKSYYGKVEIYDGSNTYCSLAGLVTVE